MHLEQAILDLLLTTGLGTAAFEDLDLGLKDVDLAVGYVDASLVGNESFADSLEVLLVCSMGLLELVDGTVRLRDYESSAVTIVHYTVTYIEGRYRWSEAWSRHVPSR